MANDTAWIERVCAGIEFCVQKGVDVINLSLGPCSTEFHPDDPLLVATKVAYDRNIPVVVAAGNFGPGKLQALAQAPWVISVGAVDDKHGAVGRQRADCGKLRIATGSRES
jgi:serine protease AprX